jgi:intein-encoded DNA endonuclease-like protein
LRKNGKKILEIKEIIKEENKINLGKRTICTWLKKLREKLEECELKDWEEVIGVLIRVENLGEERKLTIRCKRTIFVIKVPKNLKCRSLLGKRIALLKSDLPEKLLLIRELKRF